MPNIPYKIHMFMFSTNIFCRLQKRHLCHLKYKDKGVNNINQISKHCYYPLVKYKRNIIYANNISAYTETIDS